MFLTENQENQFHTIGFIVLKRFLSSEVMGEDSHPMRPMGPLLTRAGKADGTSFSRSTSSRTAT